MKYLVFIISLFIGFNGYSNEVNFRTLNESDLPQKAVSISYKKNGKIKELVMSQWVDRIKTSNGKVYRRYKQGYNYKKKKGFIEVFDLEGKLLNKKWSKNIDGGISREELFIAFELFKENSKVQKHFEKNQLSITLHGGFNFQDSRKCKPGSRCVHVFASTAEKAILVHSIIRLSDARVIYPEYDMDSNSNISHVKGM